MNNSALIENEIDLSYEFIEVNGIQLHVGFGGPTTGEPVILLHGFPDASFGWKCQIKALIAQNFYVIVPDQRGYNLSDKPKGKKNYTMKILESDIIQLADALNFEKFNLAGHDFGAMVSWNLAIFYPSRIKKMIIFNVPHPKVFRRFLKGRKEQRRKSWYIFFFRIPLLPELLIRISNWKMLASAMKGSFSKEELATYKTAWAQPGSLSAMINWYRAFFVKKSPISHNQTAKTDDSAQPHIIKKISADIPTIVAWGKQDPHLMWEMAQDSADLCERSQVVYYENATHWVLQDEAERTSQLLVTHFRPD